MPHPQILEDLPFHHRQWFLQRVGWGIGFLVLVLAVFGIFGDGPLSHVHAGSSQLRVEYDRFIRRNPPHNRLPGLHQSAAGTGGLLPIRATATCSMIGRKKALMNRGVRPMSVQDAPSLAG